MADLVTGDAVPLDVRIAGLPSRMLALAMDLVVQLILLAVSLVLVAWVFPAAEGGAAALTILSVVGALVLWPAGLETLTGGRSLGKHAMGLRVVRDDGGPVRFRHSLARALAMVFLDLWTTSGVVGGLSSLTSRRSKRMGDHLAGTIVVGERLPRALAMGMIPVPMPPQLAWWATRLDLVAVPDQLALSVRTFLHRAPSMDPAAREATAWRLAAQMASLVRQPAPPGTPAEAYLAAVVAERSRRASMVTPVPAGWQGTHSRGTGAGVPGASMYGMPPAPGALQPAFQPAGGDQTTGSVPSQWPAPIASAGQRGSASAAGVDLDSFVRTHARAWDRMGHLTRRRRLDGSETTELVDLYQRTATHLSMVRSSAPDPMVVGRLTQLVTQARGRVLGAHTPLWAEVRAFFLVHFPAAVWRSRGWILGAALGSIVVAVAVGHWVAVDPRVQAALGTPEDIRQLVNEDFEEYYSSEAASAFAARVWTNNAWISALVLIAGSLFVLPAVYVLWQNALSVGAVGGLMVANGRADVFFGLIAPHGLLELTAVFVAAGAGMRLGWQWIAPGPRPRSVALASEGRAAVVIAMGLVIVLLVSGLIEAFVTPSSLPTAVRIGIGVLALMGFLAYVGLLGRRASRAGYTGDVVGEGSATALAPMSG